MAKKTKDSNLSIEERLEQALIPNWDEPYNLPENWCWTRLETIAKWGSGGTPSRKNPDYYIGNISWIKTGELDNAYIYETEEHISENAVANSSAKLFPINTVIIAMYGATIGKVGIMGIEATTNQACACAVCSSAIYHKYLFYYAISQKDAFIKKGKGGAQPNISQEVIKQHEVPLPPLSEQHRIVELIESLFAKLDEAKEKAQEIVDGFEIRKAAILHKAFSGELTAKWREENEISMTTWKHHNFSDLCKIVRGGSPRPAGSPEFYGGDIPFMKVADITRITTPYVESTEHFIKPAGLKKTRMVKANTLLLTNSGATLGVPAICTFDTTFNDGIAAFLDLEPKSLLFYYYFWTMKTPELRAINKGAAQPNLNTDIIGAVELDVPSLDEQLVIAEMLEKFISKEQQAKETAEAVIEQIDTMKKAILARAFRGELGTNNPSEESAVELLKQVLNTAPEQKKTVKRTVIPKSLERRIKTDIERKIIKLYIQNEVDILTIDLIMGVSSKKFDIMEALKNLQQRGILEKENDKYKLLG